MDVRIFTIITFVTYSYMYVFCATACTHHRQDNFSIVSLPLGRVERVRVYHDNSGLGPGWYLEWLEVREEGKYTLHSHTHTHTTHTHTRTHTYTHTHTRMYACTHAHTHTHTHTHPLKSVVQETSFSILFLNGFDGSKIVPDWIELCLLSCGENVLTELTTTVLIVIHVYWITGCSNMLP